MNPRSFGLLVFVFLLFLVQSAQLSAQEEGEYPDQSIKLVVPFGAGGGTDTFARMIKKSIDDQTLLPQPLVIINQGGAGATIGSRRVKDSEPDGYTMMILHEAIFTAKYSGGADYGAEEFEPVAGTGTVGMVLVVPMNSPYKTIHDLMDDITQRPNSVTFGANMGALTHYVGLWLEQELDNGGQFRFVQSGGGAARLGGLIGGHIDLTGFSIEEFSRFRSDKIRPLLYFGEERHPSAPEIPTAIEEGYDISNSVMYYWWVPKGTPQDRIDYLANVLETVFKSDQIRKQLDDLQVDPIFLKGDALKARLKKKDVQMAKTEVREQTSVPNFTTIMLYALGGLLALTAILKFLQPSLVVATDEVASESAEYSIHPWLAAGVMLLTAAYVGVLSAPVFWKYLQGNFVIATSAFVIIVGLILQKKRTIPIVVNFLAGGLLLAFGLQYLFTEVFVTDLP